MAELTVYTEPSIFKKQKIINDNFNYIEFEFLDEKNNKIALTDFFYQKKIFIIYNYIIMGTQKRNYKHGDQKHLHRSIMAITSDPIYLKHKKYFILSIYNI